MIWGLPQEVVVTALYRMLVFAVVMVMAARLWRRGRLILVACAFAIGSNIALLGQDMYLSGLLGVPWVTLAAFIFLRYMWTDAESLAALIGARESRWADERHDLQAELEAQRGIVRYYQRTTGTGPDELEK